MEYISPCPICIISTEKHTNCFQQAFELQFKTKLLKAVIFFALPPHQLLQGPETTSLCLCITNQCEPSQHGPLLFSATFSKFAFHLFYHVIEDQLVSW